MTSITVKSSSGSKRLRGDVYIQSSGAMQLTANRIDGNINLGMRPFGKDSSIVNIESWYEDFISRKVSAMCFGGVMKFGETELFNFKKGLYGCYFFKDGKSYLTSLCGKLPDSNFGIRLLPSRLVDVSRDYAKNTITVSKAIDVFDPNSYYKKIYAIESWLYRAVNWQISRFFIFDLDCPRFGNIGEHVGFGPLLGSLLHTQANIARYNHNVWKSTFHTAISSYSGSAALSLGYTAIDCTKNNVKISTHLEYQGLVDDAGNYVSSSDVLNRCKNILTIYAMGEDSGIDKNNPKISTSIYRNGVKYDGTGYIPGKTSTVMSDAAITIDIAGSPAFRTGQHYFAAFAIAIPAGTMETFLPADIANPENDKDAPVGKLYHVYTAITTWYIDGYSYSKKENIYVYASRVTEDVEPEDEE